MGLYQVFALGTWVLGLGTACLVAYVWAAMHRMDAPPPNGTKAYNASIDDDRTLRVRLEMHEGRATLIVMSGLRSRSREVAILRGWAEIEAFRRLIVDLPTEERV